MNDANTAYLSIFNAALTGYCSRGPDTSGAFFNSHLCVALAKDTADEAWKKLSMNARVEDICDADAQG